MLQDWQRILAPEVQWQDVGWEYGHLSFVQDPFKKAKQGICRFSSSVLAGRGEEPAGLLDEVAGEGDWEVGDEPRFPPLPLPFPCRDGEAERDVDVVGTGTARFWS